MNRKTTKLARPSALTEELLVRDLPTCSECQGEGVGAQATQVAEVAKTSGEPASRPQVTRILANSATEEPKQHATPVAEVAKTSGEPASQPQVSRILANSATEGTKQLGRSAWPLLAAALLSMLGRADRAWAQSTAPPKRVQADFRVWERGLLSSDAELRSSSAVSLVDSTHPEATRILMAALAPDRPMVTRISVFKAAAFRRDERYLKPGEECLRAEEASLTDTAASYLGAVGSWEAFRALKTFLDAQDVPPDRKVTVITALKAYSSKAVVEVLIGQLDASAEECRKAAASVLGQIAGQQFGDDKAAWLKWWEANRALTRERWLEGVVNILNKDLQELRAENEAIEREIAQIHHRLMAALDGEQKTTEILSSLSSRHAPVRSAAAEEAGRSGLKSAVPGLLKCLKDPSSEVRAAAAEALGALADDGAIAVLIKLLGDPAVAVRAAAAKALGQRRPVQAVHALCELARSSDEIAVEASIDALGQIADSNANPTLLTALKSPSAKVREAAARALGATCAGAPAAAVGETAAGLIAALADESERVRWYSVHSLGQIGGQPAETALIGKLSDTSPRVREAAASRLGSLGSVGARDGLVSLLTDSDERVGRQAAEALTSLTQKHVDQADPLAQVFFDRGDTARAAAIWQSLLDRTTAPPQKRALRKKLATAYAALKDWPQVVAHLTEATKIPNGDPTLFALLAQAHLELEALTQAAQAFLEFAKSVKLIDAERRELSLRIAQGLAKQKDPQPAIDFISALRAADPTLDDAATAAQFQAIEKGLAALRKPKGTGTEAPAGK